MLPVKLLLPLLLDVLFEPAVDEAAAALVAVLFELEVMDAIIELAKAPLLAAEREALALAALAAVAESDTDDEPLL